MRMGQRSPGKLPLVFENQGVSEARIPIQIRKTLPVDPDHLRDLIDGHVCHVQIVLWRFDNDFVGAYAIHSIMNALTPAIKPSFNPECGKFIWNDSHLPTRLVRPASVVTDSGDFVRGFALISLAERAEPSWWDFRGCKKIEGFATSFRGDDNPTLLNRVVAKFRHISIVDCGFQIADWIHCVHPEIGRASCR